MKKLSENQLIELNRRGYDEAGDLFQASRPNIWPEIDYFRPLVSDGDRILDIGCGHGRLIELFKDLKIDYHGIDHSAHLIESARRNHPRAEFRLSDARKLPYEDRSFDSVWLIALLHHLPPSARRQAIEEAFRVTRPGGKSVFTVWQPDLKEMKGCRSIGRRDFMRKWGGRSWLYYHYFKPEELKRLVEKSGWSILETGFLKKGKRANLFVVAYRAPIA